MWKIDNTPIQLGILGDFMGLCTGFEKCGNYIIRPKQTWSHPTSKPRCAECQKEKRKKKYKKYESERKYTRKKDMFPSLKDINGRYLNKEITYDEYRKEIKRVLDN